MAGTIVADTIQTGAGASTSMANAVNGSAKAWVSWTGGGTTINGSYNVTSITRNGTGDYTINLTNAMSSVNYSSVYTAGFPTTGAFLITVAPFTQAPTTTTLRVGSYTAASSLFDATYNSVAIFN